MHMCAAPGRRGQSASQSATPTHAIELAAAARSTLGTDWGIGETGVAGPGNNSRGVVPGVTALAVVGPGGLVATKMVVPSSKLSSDRDAYGEPDYRTNPVPRDQNMGLFADAAMELLLEQLQVETVVPCSNKSDRPASAPRGSDWREGDLEG